MDDLKYITYTADWRTTKPLVQLLSRLVNPDSVDVQERLDQPFATDISCWLTKEERAIVEKAFPNMVDVSAEVDEFLADI